MARRLKKLGAVSIKKTVYALPMSEEAREDFEWLRREVEAEGATAVIAEANFVAGISNDDLAAIFALGPAGARGFNPKPVTPERIKPGSVWVTRADVHVDRIASSWMIRRFIDRRARFKFVPARRYQARSGELRFDMYEAEYTHVGEDCTLQTLVRRFTPRDLALIAIGEIVHDIDCKDDRFNRPETAGSAAMIRAICESTNSDVKRIERGSTLFDDLYSFFGSKNTRRRAVSKGG
ncbi:MAG TPA: chromate resistance protein ChrB domain-containing protein [Gemmatimonadaceae bacterium]